MGQCLAANLDAGLILDCLKAVGREEDLLVCLCSRIKAVEAKSIRGVARLVLMGFEVREAVR